MVQRDKKNEIIIGIYLGTEYSCVAVKGKNYIDVILNIQNERKIIPSMVGLKQR